ncbi:MAG TPA: alpha-L-fucosidase [Verrucomicrobiae bacterium]
MPSERQLQWEQMEFVGFAHFTVDTFTGKEWGYGDESESVFNPSDFNPAQIAGVARQAGMKELILTCKHHDGFCLWPSAFTDHSVKHSQWRGGNGDVVKDLSQACRKEGVKFGVYLSPWDRHSPIYGTPDYITYYRNQLTELLTKYGPISEVWFDGANGGDGYYGGTRETRHIDNKTYYDWPGTIALVRRLQPMACIFSDAGPDIRWVGNERGIAGDPCWETLNRREFYPGNADSERLNHGDRPGSDWLPAECDVSIRPGWFYHPSEDARVKTADQLLDIYFKSAGRGATMLLNIPPDQRGQIHPPDVASLLEFARRRDAIFARDLARLARVTASSVRGKSHRYRAENVTDGKRDTYWCAGDGVTSADIELDFARPMTFNVARLREYLPLGQRVEGFALEQWQDGQWKEFARGSSIGNCRLTRGPDVTTDKVRLRITQAAACPDISEIGLFREEKNAP